MMDFHVHTCFSDGKNTPEEVVQAAIAMGMERIGFSDHSYTAFDERYCIAKERLGEYRDCIRALKEKYASEIEVLCGIEQDYHSVIPAEGYDYVIGSTHYLHVADEYIPVDETPDILRDAAKKYFGGDIYALTEAYYANEADVVEKTGATIIGHMDLITKFNQHGELFDPQNPRYLKAAHAAADALLKTGRPFEINTGAISRGYRLDPYPSDELLAYIRARGGRFILSSDSHAAETICFQFDKWQHLL